MAELRIERDISVLAAASGLDALGKRMIANGDWSFVNNGICKICGKGKGNEAIPTFDFPWEWSFQSIHM